MERNSRLREKVEGLRVFISTGAGEAEGNGRMSIIKSDNHMKAPQYGLMEQETRWPGTGRCVTYQRPIRSASKFFHKDWQERRDATGATTSPMCIDDGL